MNFKIECDKLSKKKNEVTNLRIKNILENRFRTFVVKTLEQKVQLQWGKYTDNSGKFFTFETYSHEEIECNFIVKIKIFLYCFV